MCQARRSIHNHVILETQLGAILMTVTMNLLLGPVTLAAFSLIDGKKGHSE